MAKKKELKDLYEKFLSSQLDLKLEEDDYSSKSASRKGRPEKGN